MAVYQYKDRIPRIGKNCYISDSARVIGDVVISDNCYVGHGAILRGDYGRIVIKSGSAIEENAVLHIRPDGVLELEEKVTIGHGALVHGKRLKSFSVIGIGAVIGFDVVVGSWAIVAEGCVIPKSSQIPDNTIVTGVPYTIKGPVLEEHKAFWTYGKKLYIDLAADYEKNLQRIG